MTAPFGPSPKLPIYCEWARTEAGCKIESGHQGTTRLVRITAPSGRSVQQAGNMDDEPLCHEVMAYLDRRLGIESPFPKTPEPYD